VSGIAEFRNALPELFFTPTIIVPSMNKHLLLDGEFRIIFPSGFITPGLLIVGS
jgi:hypothetical protein